MNLPIGDSEIARLKLENERLHRVNKLYQERLSEWVTRAKYRSYPVARKDITKVLIEAAQLAAGEVKNENQNQTAI